MCGRSVVSICAVELIAGSAPSPLESTGSQRARQDMGWESSAGDGFCRACRVIESLFPLHSIRCIFKAGSENTICMREKIVHVM